MASADAQGPVRRSLYHASDSRSLRHRTLVWSAPSPSGLLQELPDGTPLPPPPLRSWPGLAAHSMLTRRRRPRCSGSSSPCGAGRHLSRDGTGSLTTRPRAAFSVLPPARHPWISRSQLSSYTTFHFLRTCPSGHAVRWAENSLPVSHRWTRAGVSGPVTASPSVPGPLGLPHSAPAASPLPCLPAPHHTHFLVEFALYFRILRARDITGAQQMLAKIIHRSETRKEKQREACGRERTKQ